MLGERVAAWEKDTGNFIEAAEKGKMTCFMQFVAYLAPRARALLACKQETVSFSANGGATPAASHLWAAALEKNATQTSDSFVFVSLYLCVSHPLSCTPLQLSYIQLFDGSSLFSSITTSG